MQNIENYAVQIALDDLSGWLAQVHQLVACNQLRLDIIVHRCTCRWCTRALPLAFTMQVWRPEEEIWPAVVGPYQECTFIRWKFSSTIRSSRQCVDNGTATTLIRALWLQYWLVTCAVFYEVESVFAFSCTPQPYEGTHRPALPDEVARRENPLVLDCHWWVWQRSSWHFSWVSVWTLMF